MVSASAQTVLVRLLQLKNWLLLHNMLIHLLTSTSSKMHHLLWCHYCTVWWYFMYWKNLIHLRGRWWWWWFQSSFFFGSISDRHQNKSLNDKCFWSLHVQQSWGPCSPFFFKTAYFSFTPTLTLMAGRYGLARTPAVFYIGEINCLMKEHCSPQWHYQLWSKSSWFRIFVCPERVDSTRQVVWVDFHCRKKDWTIP